MADENAGLLERALLLQKAKMLQQSKMAQASAPPTEQTGAAEAAIQGFGQGETLGYLPEINARVAQATQYVLPESMGGGGNENYAQLKDYFTRQNQTMKQEHPYASLGGNVAGALASAPLGGVVTKGIGGAARMIPGLTTAAEAAPAIARAGEAAATGAGYGAAMNPEEGSRLQNAKSGALLAGGLSAVGQAGAAAFPYIARATSGISPKAIKTYLTRQPEVDALITEGPNAAAQLAEETHGIIQQQFQNKKSEIGQALAKQINGAPNLISRDKIFSPIEDHIQKLANSEMSLTSEGQNEIQALRGHVDSMKEGLPDLIKPETAWDLKDRLYMDAKIPLGATKADKQIANVAGKSYEVAKGELNNAANSAGLNKKYSETMTLGDKLKKYFRDPETTERTLMQMDRPSKGAMRMTVDKMDSMLGWTPVKDNAQLLEAYGQFQHPELLPISSGGTTSTSRSLGLSSIFGAVGGLGGEQGRRVGNAIGTVAGGPLATKTAIRATNYLSPRISPYAPSTGQLPYVVNPWLNMKKKEGR